MPELTIGQVAERTGLSVHTLRFYEREGLFAHPVARDTGGRRRYGQVHVDWLGICNRLRATGMPLPAIRRYAELVRLGTGNEQERLALLRGHRDEVVAQLDELTQCLNLINMKISGYEASLLRSRK